MKGFTAVEAFIGMCLFIVLSGFLFMGVGAYIGGGKLIDYITTPPDVSERKQAVDNAEEHFVNLYPDAQIFRISCANTDSDEDGFTQCTVRMNRNSDVYEEIVYCTGNWAVPPPGRLPSEGCIKEL